MTAVHWSRRMQPDVRTILEPYVGLWLWVVPTWCHEVWLFFDNHAGEQNADAAAVNNTRYEYRFAQVTFHADLLSQSDDDRSRSVLHELLHIAHADLRNVAKDTLDAHVGDEAQRGVADAQFTRAFEQMVCDLAYAIHGRHTRRIAAE